jgi:hypothetical protein
VLRKDASAYQVKESHFYSALFPFSPSTGVDDAF